ncbi:hypothetical protein EMIT047CA2_80154 [Pseudomonas soli]
MSGKTPGAKKIWPENHLSPSRRRALRREIVQTSGGVQYQLQGALYAGSRKGAAISHCERK